MLKPVPLTVELADNVVNAPDDAVLAPIAVLSMPPVETKLPTSLNVNIADDAASFNICNDPETVEIVFDGVVPPVPTIVTPAPDDVFVTVILPAETPKLFLKIGLR